MVIKTSSKLDEFKTMLISLNKISGTTPPEYSPKNQDILRLALNESISIIIDLISIIDEYKEHDFNEESAKYEKLINDLQEKLLSQDETFKEMSEIFGTLQKLTSFSYDQNSIRSENNE